MKRYLVTDTVTVSGNEATPESNLTGETVDEQFVLLYADLQTRRFFIGHSGTEEYSKSKRGVLRFKSTSPDGQTVRIMRFTPVRAE